MNAPTLTQGCMIIIKEYNIFNITFLLTLDNNECNLDSGCTHVCTNMDCDNGRYTCSCNDGYQLGSDEHTCLGIILFITRIKLTL